MARANLCPWVLQRDTVWSLATSRFIFMEQVNRTYCCLCKEIVVACMVSGWKQETGESLLHSPLMCLPGENFNQPMSAPEEGTSQPNKHRDGTELRG